MTKLSPMPRGISGFNWRLLLLTRGIIILAAVAATWLLLQAWRPPMAANQIYAAADIVLSVAAVSKLRKAGWTLVAVHLVVSVIFAQLALLLPSGWFQ